MARRCGWTRRSMIARCAVYLVRCASDDHAAGERASLRFLEFFATNIRNPHTRRAYGRAVAEFLAWCDQQQVPSVAAVQPLHVAAWIEQQTREHAAPTAKLRLAALRHLFD